MAGINELPGQLGNCFFVKIYQRNPCSLLTVQPSDCGTDASPRPGNENCAS
ncbi:hypothetical protein D3C71_1765680 [compost metagenome]